MDLPETLEAPARPTFSTNPVSELVISNDAEGMRLQLRVSGELKEDVMVFGQGPYCSGRRKRRDVAYLGLLPPPVDGWSDITLLYVTRYGEPRLGTRVFLVTCQQKNGRKAIDRELTALVPPSSARAISILPNRPARSPVRPRPLRQPLIRPCHRSI